MSEGNCSKPFCLARRRKGETLALCHSCAAASDILPVVRMLVDPVGYAYDATLELLAERRKR